MRTIAILALLVPYAAVAAPSKLAVALGACVSQAIQREMFLVPMGGPPPQVVTLSCEGEAASALYEAMSSVSYQTEEGTLTARRASNGVQCFDNGYCSVVIATGEAFAAAFTAR